MNRSIKFPAYLRPVDIIMLGYLTVTGLLILVFRHHQPQWLKYIFIRVGLSAFILAYLSFSYQRPGRWSQLLRDWYPPLMFIYFYEETEVLNQLIVPLYFDVVVAKFGELFEGKVLWKGLLYLDPLLEYVDGKIFGFQPSLAFSQALPQPLFSEIMHLGYFFYYLLIPILGFTLWFKRRQEEFNSFIFKIALNMLWCYLFFIIVPTSGPASYFPSAIGKVFPGYAFTTAMNLILRYGGIANGALPSSHVAMATVIVLCAFKYQRAIFWLYLPFFLLLCASTVYIQQHYFIDIPTGILVGTFFYLIGDSVQSYFQRFIHNHRN